MGNSADGLPELLGRAWKMLENGARSASAPCHLGSLVTIGPEAAPDSRTVVLRAVDATSRRIACHTDARSAKVRQIRENPSVAWLFYDAQERIQLRIKGTARLHRDGPLADRQWERSSPASRRCYLAPRGPGALCEAPSPNLPEALHRRAPTERESQAGRPNFMVVETEVEQLEWLELHSTGHFRARFTFRDGDFDAVWLEP